MLIDGIGVDRKSAGRFRHGQRVRVTYGDRGRDVGTYLFYDPKCAWPHRVLMDGDGQEHIWTDREVQDLHLAPSTETPR